jgi:hypothetical protein
MHPPLHITPTIVSPVPAGDQAEQAAWHAFVHSQASSAHAQCTCIPPNIFVVSWVHLQVTKLSKGEVLMLNIGSMCTVHMHTYL